MIEVLLVWKFYTLWGQRAKFGGFCREIYCKYDECMMIVWCRNYNECMDECIGDGAVAR